MSLVLTYCCKTTIKYKREKLFFTESLIDISNRHSNHHDAQVKGLKDRLTVAESRAKDTSSYAVSDDDLLSDDMDDNFLDDDDDDYLLDDEDIELDVRGKKFHSEVFQSKMKEVPNFS